MYFFGCKDILLESYVYSVFLDGGEILCIIELGVYYSVVFSKDVFIFIDCFLMINFFV